MWRFVVQNEVAINLQFTIYASLLKYTKSYKVFSMAIATKIKFVTAIDEINSTELEQGRQKTLSVRLQRNRNSFIKQNVSHLSSCSIYTILHIASTGYCQRQLLP